MKQGGGWADTVGFERHGYVLLNRGTLKLSPNLGIDAQSALKSTFFEFSIKPTILSLFYSKENA